MGRARVFGMEVEEHDDDYDVALGMVVQRYIDSREANISRF